MKPIPPAGLARRYAPAQRVAWLLELADADWLWRGATLVATLGPDFFPARLGRLAHWREWLPDRGREGGRARASAELVVPGLPGGAGSLRTELEARAPVGIVATLRLAWLDPAGDADPAPATMLRGRLTDWRVTPAGVALTLTDELEAIGNRRIGRLLRAGMLPGAVTPALGQPLPWVFGAHDDLELMPLDIGPASLLREPIDASTPLIPVASLAGFAASGVVQIGAELIRYNAIDPAAMTLGAASMPAIRGIDGTFAAAHNKSAVVRRVPNAGAFAFLVADHACQSIATLRADGLALVATEWTASLKTIAGRPAQIVSFPLWPLDADAKPARRISAKVEGLADDANTLIQNPARVIETLLTHERLGALPTDRIDASNIAAIADALAVRGYIFAARLTGYETLGQLLDTAAEEAGLWIQTSDPIRLVFADPVPHAAAVTEDADPHTLLPPATSPALHAPEGFIPPDAVEIVGPSPGPGLGKPSYIFPPEDQAAGLIPRRYAMQWLDLQAGAAADLGELLWRRLGEAPFMHTFDLPLGASLLAAGETIRLSDPAVELDETLAWVRSIEAGEKVGSAGRARVETWGPWAGAYCWKFDAQNHIRRFAFGGHLLFVLGGKPVALLTNNGTLRIAGRLKERATFTAGPFPSSIHLASEWLYFATGSPANFTPFLRLDANGNLELKGTLRERSTITTNPDNICHNATNDHFYFSANTRQTAMEFQSSSQILHLPEILIENVRL